MFDQNNLRAKVRLTPLSGIFLSVTALLVLLFQEYWQAIVGLSVVSYLFVLVFSSLFLSWKMTPELQIFMDTYMKSHASEFDGKFASGKVVFGAQENFFTIDIQSEGIHFFHSKKNSKLLPWKNIWRIDKCAGSSCMANIILVSMSNYDGVKRIKVPWREEFWELIPIVKKT